MYSVLELCPGLFSTLLLPIVLFLSSLGSSALLLEEVQPEETKTPGLLEPCCLLLLNFTFLQAHRFTSSALGQQQQQCIT